MTVQLKQVAGQDSDDDDVNDVFLRSRSLTSLSSDSEEETEHEVPSQTRAVQATSAENPEAFEESIGALSGFLSPRAAYGGTLRRSFSLSNRSQESRMRDSQEL